MKKQFFYAALAIGMMSSCTSSDLPGNQAPEEQLPEEERVAIELGISSPNAKIEASTKGLGPVGSTDEDYNKWQGEELKILMFNSSNALVQDGTNYIFDGLKFKAPTNETSGTIGMYSAYEDATHYTKEFRYYPQTGKYSFYGYYADDAIVDSEFPQADGQFNVTIDGTQDFMTAQTKVVNSTNYPTGTNGIGEGADETPWTTAADQSFSAWSARRGIQPILVFNHQLARFRFFVKAGEADAATHEYNMSESRWDPKPAPDGLSDERKGVFITRLVTKELVNKFKVDLIANTIAAATEGTTKGKYILRSVGTDGKPEAAVDVTGTGTGEFLKTPVAPEQYGEHAEPSKKKTFVGDIMFFPTDVQEIECELNLKQALQVQEIKDGETTSETWVVKDNNTDPIEFKIKPSDIKSGDTSISNFAPGMQYDITIIVYGYQKIEITAALTAWQDGGAGEFNPSDDFSVSDNSSN